MMHWVEVVLEPQPIVLAHVGEFLRESRGLLFRSATELMSDLVGRRYRRHKSGVTKNITTCQDDSYEFMKGRMLSAGNFLLEISRVKSYNIRLIRLKAGNCRETLTSHYTSSD
jgi:hypothetical protein